ncbi:hypothetical protein XENOCAPTIV_029927 [Xenoophorus captivus]|uniref:Uncharacterized protein n=1 Tax=Xenoophorus captivus TaxID=1517983 RepID=A0ABV0RJR9_9TELE
MTRILSYDSDERVDSWVNKDLLFSEPLSDEMLQADPGWRFWLIRRRMDRQGLLSAFTAACFIGEKAEDTCELAPVTIALLVIGGGGKHLANRSTVSSFLNHAETSVQSLW